MHLETLSGKLLPFCVTLNVLMGVLLYVMFLVPSIMDWLRDIYVWVVWA